MKLSIVLPAYNVEKYISRCLDSLLNQGLESSTYEIIVIDDGSKDNSVAIVKNYIKMHPNIIVHSKINGGVGSARNKGIELAKGKYIYFIDPDDYLAQNMLSKLVDYAENNELQILTFDSTKTTSSSLNDSKINHISNDLKINIESGIEYVGNRKYQNEVWWYLINRDFLNSSGVKFIEGRWMEDAIFTANIFLATKSMSNLPLDVHRHVTTPNSAMTSKEPSHYLRVIYDNENAAVEFKSIIEHVEKVMPINESCLKRLKTRQQSYVFFMMIRILKSTIKLKDVKVIIKNMSSIKAYPLNSFLGKDYDKGIYKVLITLFNNKYLYYSLFIACNPFYKLQTSLSRLKENK